MGVCILSDPDSGAVKKLRPEAMADSIVQVSPEAVQRFTSMGAENKSILLDFATSLITRNPTHRLANVEPESMVIRAIQIVLDSRARAMGTSLDGPDKLTDATLAILARQQLPGLIHGRSNAMDGRGA